VANVVLSKTQFWSMIILGALTLAFIAYTAWASTWTGEADRVIIKRDVRQVLGNISAVDKTQTALLQELQEQEAAREIRSNQSGTNLRNLTQGLYDFVNATEIADKEQTEQLLPVFFESFNQTETLLNTTNQMLEFIEFISNSFDEEYLIDEIRQYGQSNATYGNLTVIRDQLGEIVNLLNATP
jgi:hypothetical protein